MRANSPQILTLLFLLFFGGTLSPSLSQEPHYWVAFTDKQGTPYSLDQPEEYLSDRAIERRKNAGIAIDEKDLPVDPAYRDSILAHPEVELLHSSKWLNAITVHCPDSLHMDTIDQFDFVRSGERVKRLGIPEPARPTIKSSEPEKTRDGSNDHWKHLDPGSADTQLSMLGLDALFDSGHRGKGVRIAVMDAGFPQVNTMGAFAPIFEEERYVGGFDAVDGDRYPFHGASHGRSVLSIMATQEEGSLVGSAPEASYILCRTEEVGWEYRIEEQNWIAAAEFADSAGADILTTSLSYTTFDDSTQDYTHSDLDGNSTRITRGADIAASRGMLVVSSAGNYGNSSWGTIGAPADGDSVLAVGAVNEDEKVAGFSSPGPSADGRIKPELSAMGEGTAFLGGDGNVYNGNGTSFSAPLISGGAASLWSAHPELSAMELQRIIIANSRHPEAPNNEVGFGIPNFFGAHLDLKGVEEIESGDARLIDYGPNPYRNRIELQIYSGSSTRVTILWHGPLGRTLKSEHHSLIEEQHHEMTLHPPSLPNASGLHFIELRWDNGQKHRLKLLRASGDQ